MDRTINVTVTGEFVRKDSKNAGVQGEANVTGLHIVMSDDWEAFSKRIVWRNALGESPVAVLLYNSVEDLVAKKDPLTFDTAIPAEPLALEGWCSFTIEGFRESDPTAVAITVTDHLLVKPNDAYTTPKEPTPTQAQQLQTQIDGIVPQVSTLVGNAIEALEQAEEAVKVWEAYDSAKTYLPLQKVSRLGSSYICKAACKGVAPELDVAGGVEGAHWLLIASKGDQGEQGAEGPQGKTGKQGSMVKKGTEVVTVASLPVDHVVDTTGAGDFYAAGFLYGLTSGYSLEKCARISSVLAGYVIQVTGTDLSKEQWNEIKLNIEAILHP